MVGSAGLTLPLSAELADAVDRWIEWLRSERRYSEHTLSGYVRDLNSFLEFQNSRNLWLICTVSYKVCR